MTRSYGLVGMDAFTDLELGVIQRALAGHYLEKDGDPLAHHEATLALTALAKTAEEALWRKEQA